tara:strand:- start:58 stop:183 length:126 start_codon:yes stop_codon:yes gene_type:complete
MPVYLRRFYIKTLIKEKEKEKKAIEKQNNQSEFVDPRLRYK